MSFQQFARLFPIGCEADWYCSSKIEFANIDNWLLHTGSLTERLKQNCQSFEVIVLGQEQLPINQSEKKLLLDYTPFVIREVLLVCDNQPWVFARSLLPKNMLDEQTELTNLGNKPLGSIIFNNPEIARAPFEVAEFNQDSSIQALSRKLNQPEKKSLWGRRSLLSYQSHQLMVAEIFLPSSPAYRE